MLKWSSPLVWGIRRYIRSSYLNRKEYLPQVVYLSDQDSNIQRKRQLLYSTIYYESNHHLIPEFARAHSRQLRRISNYSLFKELEHILELSDDLIHQSSLEPFNKLKIVTLERCLRFWARYLGNLQNGTMSPLQSQRGMVTEERVAETANLLWHRVRLDSENRSDAIISGRIYSHMIDIMARSGRAVEAEKILKEMAAWTISRPITCSSQEKSDEFNSLQSALFSTVINAFAKTEPTSTSSLQERRRDKNSTTSGLDRAEALLKYQSQLYQQLNKPFKIKPNIICYTALLDAYARKGDGSKAEALLEDLLNHDFKVTTTTFNVVIAAWSRASGLESNNTIKDLDHLPARKAEQILVTMEERSKGHARPDVISFSSGKSTS